MAKKEFDASSNDFQKKISIAYKIKNVIVVILSILTIILLVKTNFEREKPHHKIYKQVDISENSNMKGTSTTSATPSTTTKLDNISAIPSHKPVLKDHMGNDFIFNNLVGNISVVNFIFTRCHGPCPIMSSKMSELNNATLNIKDGQRLRFLSISVDPHYDSVDVISQYAKKYSVDPKRWLFITGDRSDIYKLIENNFKLAVEDNSEKNVEDIITHSSKFVILDENLNIIEYIESQTDNFNELMVKKLEHLLNKKH